MAEEFQLKQDYIPLIEGGVSVSMLPRHFEQDPPQTFCEALDGSPRVPPRKEYVLNRLVNSIFGIGSFVFYYYTLRGQSDREQAHSARRALALADEQAGHLIDRFNAVHDRRTLLDGR